MENEEHQHLGKTVYINGMIYCGECKPKDLDFGNECFCGCHQSPKFLKGCSKCVIFHSDANN